jgi:hypothetical protein
MLKFIDVDSRLKGTPMGEILVGDWFITFSPRGKKGVQYFCFRSEKRSWSQWEGTMDMDYGSVVFPMHTVLVICEVEK